MNLIKKYWENVHMYTLLLTYGNCLSAGIFYTCCKLCRLYPEVSWNQIFFFDGTQFLYLAVSVYLIIKNHLDSSIFPTHFRQIKLFVTISLFFQYNLVFWIFPTDHVWSCTFLFLIIAVFYLDVKFMLVHVIGYWLFLAIAFTSRPEKFWQPTDAGLEPLFFHILILFLTSVSMIFLTYFVQHFLIQAQMDEYENAFLLEKQLENYQRMDLLDRELRSFRHDINNHFISIQYLLDEQNYDELKSYFQDLRTSFSFQKKIYFSGNVIIDSIMNCELPQAVDDAIQVTVTGSLPGLHTVTSMDLCTLFSNILSNALKAIRNAHLPSPELSISFESGNNYFAITVLNHAKSQQKIQRSLPFASVQNRNHGYGLGKIREICEKYDGSFEQKHEGSLVTTRVYLPI